MANTRSLLEVAHGMRRIVEMIEGMRRKREAEGMISGLEVVDVCDTPTRWERKILQEQL